MRLADFDFELPPDRIAQRAVEPRDASRLLVLERRTGATMHRRFADLPGLLHRGDTVVLNDTRVIPARLLGERPTGGKIECFLVRDRGDGRWEALLRAGGRPRAGERLRLGGGELTADLLEQRQDGSWLVRLGPLDRVPELVARLGQIPLPPYIDRPADEGDKDRYQTIFARVEGAVAAPTAGLHFTPDLLARLDAAGIDRAFVTLHVGPGTFRPIEVDDPREHRLSPEAYEVPEATPRALEATRARGGRIVACGTTSVRTLECFARAGERRGETGLFIYPGFEFRAIDALITNFHLPRSTLLLLVSAFAGREKVLEAYREAIATGYRFYSYGDAMLIL